MWVKICGCRSAAGVDAAVRAGADAVGFILVPGSRRAVALGQILELAERVPAGIARVGVVASPTRAFALRAIDSGLDTLQVIGRLPRGIERLGIRLLRTVHLPDRGMPHGRLPRGDWLHLDRRRGGELGGTGLQVNFTAARRIAAGDRPVVLAGGLTPANVAAAIAEVRPFGVDVASGIERGGEQSPEDIARFVHAAKEATV